MASDGAKNDKPRETGDPAQSETDPDVLAIRALMESQQFDIVPKSDDQPLKMPSQSQAQSSQGEQPASPLHDTARHTKPEIETAIGTMIAEAEKIPPEEAPAPCAPGSNTSAGTITAQAAHPSHPARIARILSQLGTFAWQVLRHPKTPRVAFVVLMLAAFILRPVLMIIVMLFLILAAAVIYFSVGPEAVDGYILRRFEALRKRDPERADQLRGRTIRGISVLNKLIDRLPERWTAGLYLPDLEDPVDPPEKMNDDPFERLEPVKGGQHVVRKACPLPPDPRERKASPTDVPRRPPRQIRP